MGKYQDLLRTGDPLGKNAIAIMVLRVLRKMSDEEHALNASDIIQCISEGYEMVLDRKTVYNAIETLRSLGYEIERGKSGHGEGFYLALRQYEPEEIILLKSAIDGFPFISETQSEDLIKKIYQDCSDYFISQNDCLTIIGPDNKSLNKDFFSNVYFIRDAINQKKMISFDYCAYGEDLKLHPKTETPYMVNPYAMSFHGNHFYLVCALPNQPKIALYRMDYIKNIKITEDPIDRVRSKDEIKESLHNVLYAYPGEGMAFTLRFNKDSLKYVIDQFGTNIILDKDGDYCQATVHSTRQGMQYWALQFLKVIEVIKPEDFRQELIDILKDSTYLRETFSNLVEKKPYTKYDIAVLIEQYADNNGIPIEFTEDDEHIWSIKNLTMGDLDNGNEFRQMLQVSDERAQSFCIVDYKDDLDIEVLEKISCILNDKYNCVFIYEDDGGRCFWTHVGFAYSYFKDAEVENFNPKMQLFYDESVMYERLFYNAYVAVVEKGMSIEDAIAFAEKELEENGNKFAYKYNLVKKTVEEKGPRYVIEHRVFRDYFFSDPLECVKQFTELDTESDPDFAYDLFRKFLDDYDLPYVPDYNEITFKVLSDTPEKKIVQIAIPHGSHDLNCSDIFLVVSDKETLYYTVELGVYSNPNCIMNDFFLCAWDENDTHMQFGHFPVRDKAVKEFNKRMKEL